MLPIQQPETSPWCHVDAGASWDAGTSQDTGASRGSLHHPDCALQHTAWAGQRRPTPLAFEAVVINECVKT